MSFIGNESGQVYAPGWFLAHEECERKTRTIAQTGATTAANGSKYVKMGTFYPSNASGTVLFILTGFRLLPLLECRRRLRQRDLNLLRRLRL